MKNLKFLVIAAAMAISIAGCKKDSNAVNNSIVGTWLINKQISKLYRDGVIKRDTVHYYDYPSFYLEFKADGTGKTPIENKKTPTTYTVLNNKITITNKAESENNVLVFDIKLLNQTELILYDETLDKLADATYKTTSELFFKRK